MCIDKIALYALCRYSGRIEEYASEDMNAKLNVSTFIFNSLVIVLTFVYDLLTTMFQDILEILKRLLQDFGKILTKFFVSVLYMSMYLNIQYFLNHNKLFFIKNYSYIYLESFLENLRLSLNEFGFDAK